MILRLFFLLIFIASLTPLPASAHIAGQPPFFLMNDRYADYYPVYTTSLSNFSLPQDIAPETYVVNQPITMKIDKTVLPFPPEVIETIQFSWDYGDGGTNTGIENTHTYTKPGSYLLKVNADYGGYAGPDAQPTIQAVLIQVLPNKEYKLPQAKIVINNKGITDPLTDTITLPSGEKIILDASSSIQGTAPITEYFWDLGNGEKSSEKKLSFSNITNQAYLFPFLRVKDANGFISDTYIQIENTTTQNTTNKNSFLNNFGVPLLIGGNIVIIGGALWYILRKKK